MAAFKVDSLFGGVMRVVQWSEALSVGNGQMDADHRELFGLLERLRLAVQENQPEPLRVDILGELVKFSEKHFRLEELLMARAQFPDQALHRAEHEKLLAQIRELYAKVSKGDLPLSLSVFQFLYGWLARHIEVKDKVLASTLPPHAPD
jgi:hemerythrin